MTRMLVMVPSRERPGNVARFAAAAAQTVTGDTDVVFLLDGDDPRLRRSVTACGWWQHEVRPRELPGAVAKLNAAASACAGRYDVLMYADDDCVPRTRGWDELITAAIDGQGGTGMAYPGGRPRTDVPELVAISTDIVAALGWFGPPGIRHYWVDSAWADLGRGAGCLAHVPEAVLEHLHWTTGAADHDPVYALGERFFAADRAAYEQWRDTRMEADLAVVVRALGKGR